MKPEQVRELLAASEAHDFVVNDLTPSVVLTPHGRIAVGWSSNRDPAVTERAEATAALIAAAPALARTVLEQAAELERLRDGERQLREYFTALAEGDHHESAQDAYRHAAEMVAAALARPAAAEAGAKGGEG